MVSLALLGFDSVLRCQWHHWVTGLDNIKFSFDQLSGVNDTVKFWLSGVNDTAEFWLSGVIDTAESWLSGGLGNLKLQYLGKFVAVF